MQSLSTDCSFSPQASATLARSLHDYRDRSLQHISFNASCIATLVVFTARNVSSHQHPGLYQVIRLQSTKIRHKRAARLRSNNKVDLCLSRQGAAWCVDNPPCALNCVWMQEAGRLLQSLQSMLPRLRGHAEPSSTTKCAGGSEETAVKRVKEPV
jgi:hypothetical protein